MSGELLPGNRAALDTATELEEAVEYALHEHPHGAAWVVGWLTSALDEGASPDETALRLRENTEQMKPAEPEGLTEAEFQEWARTQEHNRAVRSGRVRPTEASMIRTADGDYVSLAWLRAHGLLR